MQNIVFIGAGSIAEALLQGWVKKEVFAPQNIYVSNRTDNARLEFLQNNYGVNALPNKEFLQQADLIILAVKPKDAKSAMADIQEYLLPETAILSVLAGISIDTIEEGLGARPIARTMPNTSATIGMSASGIAFNELVTIAQKNLYLQMLEAIGTVIEVEEDKLHAVTALSGSGPAYIYYLIEAFETAGTEFGLTKDIARSLMVQTIAGTAAMLQQTTEEPSELRRKVTSPGGTTEAGLRALQENHFKEAIFECVRQAENRSRELAQGK